MGYREQPAQPLKGASKVFKGGREKPAQPLKGKGLQPLKGKAKSSREKPVRVF